MTDPTLTLVRDDDNEVADVVRPIVVEATEATEAELRPDVAAAIFADPFGWSPPEGLTYAEWETIGVVIKHISRSIMWAVGDWYRFGEGPDGWGEAFYNAMSELDLADGTVSNYGWICGQYPREVRDQFDETRITPTHFKLCAPIPDLDDRLAMLGRAEANSWSTRQLSKAIAALADDGTDDDDIEPPDQLPDITDADIQSDVHTEMMSWRVALADKAKSAQMKKLLQAELVKLGDELGVTFLP